MFRLVRELYRGISRIGWRGQAGKKSEWMGLFCHLKGPAFTHTHILSHGLMILTHKHVFVNSM